MERNKIHQSIRTRMEHLLIASVIISLTEYSLASPVFMENSNIGHLQFQSGRNIRHLPCLVKRSGMEGTCMFAIDCLKSNGTHLGTCIDRFYFGSCCQLKEESNSILEHEIIDNSIDDNTIVHYPSNIQSPTVLLSSSSTNRPLLPATTIPSSSLKPPPLSFTSSSYAHDSSSSSTSTTDFFDQSTLPATTKFEEMTLPETTTDKVAQSSISSYQVTRIPTTTENIKFSTYQSIEQDDETTTFRTKLTTTPRAQTSKRPSRRPPTTTLKVTDVITTITPPISKNSSTTQASYKPTQSLTTTKRPKPNQTTHNIKPSSLSHRRPTTTPSPITTTEIVNTISAIVPTRHTRPRPTRRPTVQSTKLSTTSSRPTTTAANTKPPTAKPPTTVKKPIRVSITTKPTSSTSSKPPSSTSSKPPSLTVKPTKPHTTPSSKPHHRPSSSTSHKTTSKRPTTPFQTTTPEPFTTISFVQSTSAPRPKPKPTSHIEKVPPTSLDHLIEDENDQTTLTVAQTTPSSSTIPTSSSSTTTTITTIPIRTSQKPTSAKPTTSTKPTTSKTTVTPTPTQTTTTISSSTETSTVTATTKRPSQETTQQKPTTTIQEADDSTTSKPGIVTWSDLQDEKKNSSDWVLISQDTTISSITNILNTTDDIGDSSTITMYPPFKPLMSDRPNFITSTISSTVPASNTSPSSTTLLSTVSANPSTLSLSTSDEKATTTQFGTTIGLTITTNTISSSTTESIDATPAPPSQSTTSQTTQPDKDQMATTAEGFVIFRENVTISPAITPPPSLPATTTTPDLTLDNVTTTFTTELMSSTISSLENADYRQVCGRRIIPQARIVGGAKAAFGRWPWQISLRQWRTSTYLHKCGAALLNENWAITAAHCVDNVPPSDLLLRLGEYDLAEEEEPYGYQERRVQIVASHPQFDPRTFEYDLALLRFYEPVVFQPNIIPVCVPDTDENFIGRTAFVTGWGRLYEDGPLPSVLQEVSVPVIKNGICEDMYRAAGYIEHIPHIFICAGWKKGGYDSCEGDSGGPMVIQREDKRFLLTGVISWGIGCAEPNQPGVYTRISEFRDWINQILQF